MRQQTVQAALFLQTATNPANTRKRLQRFRRAIDVRGLAVIHIAHAVFFADQLAAVRQTGVGLHRLFDRFGANAQGSAGRIGGTSVLVVMRPRKAKDTAHINRRHLTPLTPFGEEPFARKNGPAFAVQFPSRGNTDHTIICLPFGQLVGEVTPLNLVHANYTAIRTTFGEQAALGREIAAQSRMPIQMIGRQVGEHTHIGRHRTGKIGLVG